MDSDQKPDQAEPEPAPVPPGDGIRRADSVLDLPDDPNRFPYATWSPWIAFGGAVSALILGLMLALPILWAAGGDDYDNLSWGVKAAVQLCTALGFLAVPFLFAKQMPGGVNWRQAAGRLGFHRFKVGTAAKWIGIGFVAYIAFAFVFSRLGLRQRSWILGHHLFRPRPCAGRWQVRLLSGERINIADRGSRLRVELAEHEQAGGGLEDFITRWRETSRWPAMIAVTGTSSFLPVRVCGMPGAAMTSSGTCRGDSLVLIADRMVSTSSSSRCRPGARVTNSGIQ